MELNEVQRSSQEQFAKQSHQRLITPLRWRELCTGNGLTVEQSLVRSFKQPDLNWYFETAATTPANREKVLGLIETAPASAKKLFGLTVEDGKIIWWWQRLTLIARKL